MGITEASLTLNKMLGFEIMLEEDLPGLSGLYIHLGKGQQPPDFSVKKLRMPSPQGS